MSTDKKEPAIADTGKLATVASQQNTQDYCDFVKNGHPLMSPKMPLPVPSDYQSYGEYSTACILYVEAISFGPSRIFAQGLMGGSMWSSFMNPEWPSTWTDKPWDVAPTKAKSKRGRKMRDGAWQEMGLVALMRDVGNWSWGQIKRRMNHYSGNVRTWERWKQVYKDGMRLMEAKEGQVFEAFRVRCNITDELIAGIAAELGVKMPKLRLVTTKQITH